MLHVVAHARPGTLIFRSWPEGMLLWRAIVARVSFRALVVMPDHLHALVRHGKEKGRLVHALVGFAQARNALRGERGPVWTEGIEATPVRGLQHVRRSVRYLHLNPARRALVDDPLAWPLSTHRDCVGLALPAVREVHRDPRRFHEWVSADPSVNPEGTLLPELSALPATDPSLEAIRAAVSALTRTTLTELSRRGPARTLLLCAAREFSEAPPRVIAQFAGVDVSTVRRAAAGGGLRLVERVLGDPRFPLLHDGDLRRLAAWHPYRHRR